MTTSGEREHWATKLLQLYNVTSPVRARLLADADGHTCLPNNQFAPARTLRPPLYYCCGRAGRCPHSELGCNSRDQHWEIARQFAGLYCAKHELEVSEAERDHFARALVLPRGEFVRDVWLCNHDVVELMAIHEWVPEQVIRERMAELSGARVRLVG